MEGETEQGVCVKLLKIGEEVVGGGLPSFLLS